MTDLPRGGIRPAGDSIERRLRAPDAPPSPLGQPDGWPLLLQYAARFLFDSATPAFIGWGDALCLLYNDAAVELLGDSHPGLLGGPLRSCWPEAWSALRPALARVLGGESFQEERPAHALRRAGSEAGDAWVRLSFAPLRGLDGGVLGFSCAVTETTALRESEAKFRAITNAMPQMVWSTLPDGYHDYYNQRWYEYTGMREGETDGELWAIMFHPDDRARAWERWRHALETGDQYEIEYRLRHHSGEYRWVLGRALPVRNSEGRIVRWMGTCTEIHQQKRNEEVLLDAQLRLAAALVAADIGTWTYDLRTDRVYADRNLARMFGVDEEQAAGGRIDVYLAMVHPDDVASTQAAIAQAVGAGAAYECTYRLRDPGGGWRHVLARGKVTFDDAGQLAWLPGIVLDVTRQREAEQALREADRRKDEFLAMLAHELRNPLAPITAAADFLRIGKPDEARIRQVTAIIARQASHMTGLIDDLLDVSRVTRGLITLEKRPVPLAGLVTEAVEQVRPLLKAREHHLELHMPPDDALVHGDRKRLVQIFANLLGNAAKYTPDGGRIDLHIRLGQDVVEVDVCDNGIGMGPDLVARAFELFSQGERSADRSQGGLGIGLALVKSLVELHGGQVAAHSAGSGQGSRFTVTLPRYHEQGRDEDAAAAVPDAAPVAALEVLIVDDNVDAAEIMAMYIDAIGHRATVFHSPQRALDYAAQHRPDLCVLDIGLPEFDGHELARRLRAMPGMQHLPLVAVSGYGQAQDRDKALAAGFDRHFVKPVRAADILEVMDAVAKAKGLA